MGNTALRDLCGKASGVPLYKLFGGALRQEVDYFYYLHWGDPHDVAAQCRDGVARGCNVFYIKVGVDEIAEETMLAAVRESIGSTGRIRLDVNQSWTIPQAVRLLDRWHDSYQIDFVEAPVPIDPVDNMWEVKRRMRVPLSANEELWREADALRIIHSRCADYLCISAHWVGSQRRLDGVIHAANAAGQQICKHTHGEFGLIAAVGQHMMLATPNAYDGHHQTAQFMADDILVERIPIADGPKWGLVEDSG